MSRPMKSAAAVLAGAVALAFGAYALGSQSGQGTAAADRSANASAPPRRGPGGPGLGALASKLGVTPATLRSALDDLRPDRSGQDPRERFAAALAAALGLPTDKVAAALAKVRPDRGERTGPPAELVNALAKELGLDADKVRAAFEKVKPQGRPGPGADRGQFLAALAEELGVEQAKLEAALQKIRPDGPRGPGGRGPGGPGGPGGGGPGGPGPDPARRAAFTDALAKELGVQPAALSTALEKVRSDERAAFAAALAKRLNLPEAKVEDALRSLPGLGGRRP